MIDRREFCRSLAVTGTTAALLGLVEVSAQAQAMDLEEATIGDLQLGMQKGTMSSESITAWAHSPV
jgi:phosphodiesterase/alkaline phosphatase D-like protein